MKTGDEQMTHEFKSISESKVLDENSKKALQEEMTSRLKDAETAIREEVKAEYAARYQQDMEELVEAVDNFLDESVNKEYTDFYNDKREVIKERAKLTQARHEAKKVYEQKLQDHMKLLEGHIQKQLAKEIKELYEDKKLVEAEKIEVAKKLHETKKLYKRQLAERCNMLEKFVWDQLSKEMTDFYKDKKALVEKRAEMIEKGEKALNEARKTFITKAAGLVEATLENTLKNEMRELKEDIKVSNQNRFGRKLFEAFASEFMTTHLADNTQSKKLMIESQKTQEELANAMNLLKQQKDLLERQNRKVKMLEESSKRNEVLNTLLSPLNKEKKRVMEEMLENTKTERLEEQFNYLLPIVLNNGSKDVKNQAVRPSRSALIESKANRPQSREATGNRRQAYTVLNENVSDEMTQAISNEVAQIRKLSGLKG